MFRIILTKTAINGLDFIMARAVLSVMWDFNIYVKFRLSKPFHGSGEAG